MADSPQKMIVRYRGSGTQVHRGLGADSDLALFPTAACAVLVPKKGCVCDG